MKQKYHYTLMAFFILFTQAVLAQSEASSFQQIIPAVVEKPVTGIEKVKNTQALLFFQELNIPKNQWMNREKLERKPFNDSLYKEINSYRWSNGSWLPKVKDTYVFSFSGNKVEHMTIHRAIPGEEFRYRFYYSYNTAGQIQTISFQKETPLNSGSFEVLSTSYLEYDTAGKRIKDSTIQKGNTGSSRFYEYEQGVLLASTWKENNGAGYDSSRREEYSFDNAGRLVQLSSYQYNTLEKIWQKQNRYSYQYGNHGELTMHTQEKADELGEWQVLENGLYFYNTAGQLEDYRLQNNVRYFFQYLAGGKLKTGEAYKWNGIDWKISPFIRISSQEPLTTDGENPESSIEYLYPQPAHDKLNVVLNAAAGPSLLRILDLQGKTWLTYEAGNTGRNIELSLHTLTPGLYILQTEREGLQSNRKFIVL